MDRRQQKTRTAIFDAFSELLSEESYSRITIQTIIDRANIIDGVMNHDLPADHHNAPGVPDPVFCHILQHIKDNSYHIKDLLISESSDIFLKYFRDSLRSLISIHILQSSDHQKKDIPDEFLLNHITGSFVEMVQWWVKNRMKQTPEELDFCFRSVIYPII